MKINSFDIDYSSFKKYKVYLLICDESIFYIGCTTDLKARAHSHISSINDNTKKFNYINDCIESGKRIQMRVAFEFEKKVLAAIAEKILIHFVRKFINTSLFNGYSTIDENKIIIENPRANIY